MKFDGNQASNCDVISPSALRDSPFKCVKLSKFLLQNKWLLKNFQMCQAQNISKYLHPERFINVRFRMHCAMTLQV
jgi:hypothetical protein